jgi:hypothetical protein
MPHKLSDSEQQAVTLAKAASLAGRFIETLHLGELPLEEQAVWESLGARFDAFAVPPVSVAAETALDALVGDSITGIKEVARYLGVDRTRVSQMITSRSLYSFETAAGTRCFPRWQFYRGRPLRGLPTVLGAIPSETHPLTVAHWMVSPSTDLNVGEENLSPVQWLASGGSPELLATLASDL